jgi:putative pyruvate formate lyase activating enzyme
MSRHQARIRIDDDGRLEVVDPGFDSLDLLRAIDPDFQVRTTNLPEFNSPRFLRARENGCGVTTGRLVGETDSALWEAHDAAVNCLREDSYCGTRHEGEASLLELKIELARRALTKCDLCAHRCGVDRSRGELGVCRLGVEVAVAEHFVHIAEESPINPSLVLNLAGCGLRCRFCQQAALLDPSSIDGEQLEPSLWSRLNAQGARSLSFVGGNPDESLYAILLFLAGAPHALQLPVVWNCHAYATTETVALLDGVVDVFLPDFKYGSEACGRRLSAVPNYPETARSAVSAMLARGVPVLVRVLVLPGHFECCHAPALDFLASVGAKNLLLSVRDQYSPDWKITGRDGALSRRVTTEEADAVRHYATSLGLALID